MIDETNAGAGGPVADKPPVPVRKVRRTPPPKQAPTEGLVWVTIQRAGSGKVHDGKGGRCVKGDRLQVDLATAKALEARFFADMDDG